MAGKKKNLDEPVSKRMVFPSAVRKAYTAYRERMLKKGTFIPSDEIAINDLIIIGNKADKAKSKE